MKKSFLASLWAAVFITCSSFAQNKTVTVFSDEFAGSQATLGIGKYTYIDLVKQGAALVRSVRVPEGLMVTLYDSDNFQGSSLVLTDDASQQQLSARGFGTIASNISIQVAALPEALAKAPFITIYKDNFSGPSRKLRAGTYDHFELGSVGNDAMSSVKIPKGLKVTLYEHGQMGGRKLELTTDANAAVLTSKKFNDITSSILVEELPAEVVVQKPVVVTTETVKPVETKTTEPVAVKNEPEIKGPFVTIYFSNSSKRFPVGRFDADAIGSDRTLQSIRMPAGLRIVLYPQPAFKGKSLTIDEDMTTRSYFESKQFPSVASLIVEAIPAVTVYQGNYDGDAHTFYEPGRYDASSLGIGNDELSSIKVGPGFWVLVFEDNGFGGRSMLLTKDASGDFMAGRNFDDLTSSMIIGKTTDPLPVSTLFQDNLGGASLKLTPGEYKLLEMNNSVSSVEVPRGIRVTLYDEPDFAGKSIELRASINMDRLQRAGFDNVASSAKVEILEPRDYTATIYVDRFSGFGQDLLPGKYLTRDIEIGDNQITSIHVPAGMRVTLYSENNFNGFFQPVDRDTDFSNSHQNDVFSSLIVEDVYEPIIKGVPVVTTTTTTTTTQPQVEPVKVVEVPVETQVVVAVPSCEMTEKEFYTALKAVEAKAFSQEKMTTARLATQGKCLSVDQIRKIAQQFQFEDQTLEFVKYAYDSCNEKSMYYTLEDVFKFMSSKDSFTKFLSSK